MTQRCPPPRRPRFHLLRYVALSAIALLAIAFAPPVMAQDFFDWLEGAPPKKKQEEEFKGEVPEAVQRDALPELTPPPESQPPPNSGGQSYGRNATGEPVPRGPNGEAHYDGNSAPAAEQSDTGGQQFDPLESRRRRYQGSEPAAAPAPRPAAKQWRDPDADAPRRSGERYAPGSFEDEQQQNSPESERGYDDNGPDNDGRQSMRAPDPRAGGASPDYPRGYEERPAPTTRAPDRRGYDEAPRYAPQDGAPPRAPRYDDGPRSETRAPEDAWAGMAVADLEENLSKVELPPRSAAIHDLWLRLITAPGTPNDAKFAAVRADALNRTGLIRDAADALAKAGDVSADPVIATLAARTAIGAGNTEQGCETARSLTSAVAAKMPPHLKGEVILIAGFCAAASDNKPAAGIAGDLAIENGMQDHAGPAALKAIAAGHKPSVERGKKVSLLDYRILQLGGPVDLSFAIATASPALLAVLARDDRADPGTRLAAAEAAAALNAIPADELAAAYRASADKHHNVELSDAAADAGQPTRRAALFVAAETERTPLKKSRVIRAFLDEARRAGFYWPALKLMSRPANDLQPIPEIGWFAETAVEASLAGGDFDGVRRWADFAGSQDSQNRADLRHWLALADIAEPNARDRTQHLVLIEEMAQRGRFDAVLLHRLATTLDALDTNVPMPLWEAASRTEQPSSGHLPDTGVLSQLQDAAKQHNFARTVLLTMRTIGPGGAEGAHMIALGDSIRALKRAGFEAEARHLALEALFPAWPRAGNS